MAIRIRISNTSGNTTLAQHDLVTDAEVAAASADIIAAWGGANAQEAAQNSLRFMVKAWRKQTISLLRNNAVADELTAYHAAEDAAEATYADRFEDMP